MATVPWAAIDAAASSRYGVITDRYNGELLTAKQLRALRRTGQLERIHLGVHRTAGAPVTPEQLTFAAVCAGGSMAAASHRSAARLQHLVDAWPANPEITVFPPRFPRLRNVDVHRSSALIPERITVVGDIPVTAPDLTLLHLGAVAGRLVVARAVERAITNRLLTIQALGAILDEAGASGRNGAGVLREVLDDRALGSDRADSELEERFARLVRRYGLPTMTYHHCIEVEGRFVAEVDFAYPQLLIAVEVDGWEVHGTPRAMQLDFERQANIEDLGWRVLRFTWRDVVRRPEYVANRIGRVLRARTTAVTAESAL